MWKNIYHQVLEPTVFKYTGLIDKQWVVKVNKGSRATGVRGRVK